MEPPEMPKPGQNGTAMATEPEPSPAMIRAYAAAVVALLREMAAEGQRKEVPPTPNPRKSAAGVRPAAR